MGPQPFPERRSVRVRGLQISYLEWGLPKAGRPSILCLHGLIATAETLALIAGALAQDRHVLAVDLPGNGASGLDPGLDASFTGLARFVLALAHKLGLHRPILLGHSHGGAIALQAAVLERSFSTGLILLSPAHPFSGHEKVVVAFFLSPPGRVAGYLLPWLPRFVQLAGFRNMGQVARLDSSRWDPYRRNLQKRGMVGHTLQLLKSWNADMDHLGSALRRSSLNTPVLLLWGTLDDVVPANTAPALEQWLPESRLILLDGVGHLPNEEAPERCVAEIRQWLAALTL